MPDEENSIRTKVTKGGEEAIGRFAQELLEHPVVSGAITAVFETRERATRAQEVAMGALNLPSASDLERLTRRLRGISQRLEGLEDGLDNLQERIERLGSIRNLSERLDAIDSRLERIERALGERGPEGGRAASA
jgi:predicted  nucleic acid-binding Zn-ribbon protein